MTDLQSQDHKTAKMALFGVAKLTRLAEKVCWNRN